MIRRLSDNPLLTPADVAPSDGRLRVLGIFNPAAFLFEGKVCLLARVAEAANQIKEIPFVTPIWSEEKLTLHPFADTDLPEGWDADPRIFTDAHGRGWLTSLSHLRFYQSEDGGKSFSERADLRILPSGEYESYGIEDPRVIYFEGRYLIYYTSVSERGVTVSCIETKDFHTLRRHGIVLAGPNKDVSLVPERIEGQCVIVHRPMDVIMGKPTVWTATGPDPFTFTNHTQFMRPGAASDNILKVGGGPEPMRCSKGWLYLLHTCSTDERYELTLALAHLDDPGKLLAVAQKPLISPEMDWEKRGFFGEVVFSNGWVALPDGRVLIYYGASDECIGGAETTLTYLESFFDQVS